MEKLRFKTNINCGGCVWFGLEFKAKDLVLVFFGGNGHVGELLQLGFGQSSFPLVHEIVNFYHCLVILLFGANGIEQRRQRFSRSFRSLDHQKRAGYIRPCDTVVFTPFHGCLLSTLILSVSESNSCPTVTKVVWSSIEINDSGHFGD